MKTPARYVTSLFLAVGIFFAGYLANRQKDPATSLASAEQTSNYSCPMHPQYRSDRAGDCPICGMRLEPVNAGNKPDPMHPETPGTVQISAVRQQLIGVRTDEVTQSSSSHMLRVPGRITVDDQRLYRIIAATDGWILNLGQNTVGHFVKQKQLLASYYTRDLLSSERLFLLSVDTNDPLHKIDAGYATIRTSTSANPQFPVDSLRGLGMSDLQIEELQQARTSIPYINIYSPISGFVLTRNVSPQQRFDKGTEFYRIADISHVWVMTDVFEKDREFVKPGTVATIRYHNRQFQARLSDALPQLDPQTRTLKTRFELDNPGNILLPDMFVDVELTLDTASALTVPAEAVIDSGRRKTVYVERGNGFFEPRFVETGWRMGERVQITSGLESGELIVVAGNFLIDSESRMKLTDFKSNPPATEKPKMVKDLVCGMDVDPKSPDTLKSQFKGTTFYFCGSNCKKNFDANPGKYIQKTVGTKAEKARDLVCGMNIDIASDTPKSQYKGKTYYFCSKLCKKSFDTNPEEYVHKGMAGQDMHGHGMDE
jgi:membrane fusion protein, copper/silver efflux system